MDYLGRIIRARSKENKTDLIVEAKKMADQASTDGQGTAVAYIMSAVVELIEPEGDVL